MSKIQEILNEFLEKEKDRDLPYEEQHQCNVLLADLHSKLPQIELKIVELIESQPAYKALSEYQQADADGIMVLIPRQAIEETKEFIKNLTS